MTKTDRTAADAAEPELSYEQARSELAAVVAQLESGGASLAESMALWERGEHLADICQRWLDGARARIDAAAPLAADDDQTASDVEDD